MDSEKINKLLGLHLEIGKRFEEAKANNLDVSTNGVFLPANSKPRFDVVFVGKNPSTTGKKTNIDGIGNWNASKTDILLQDYLSKFNLEGVYVTDYCHFGRAESKTEKISNEELKKFAKFFKKEIEIIKPTIIVCLGGDAYDLVSETLQETIQEKKIKLEKFWHPGAASQGHGIEKLKENWDKKFSELKTSLE